jgi:Transposase DDE domain
VNQFALAPAPSRSRSGSKHHLIACGRGTPLAVGLTGGNRNDITEMTLVDAIPAVRGRRDRLRRRPRRLYGDRAYHSREAAANCVGAASRRRSPGPSARTAPDSAGAAGSSRTIAWLHQNRRLRIRYERRADIHEAFLAIGYSLICLKLLEAEQSALAGNEERDGEWVFRRNEAVRRPIDEISDKSNGVPFLRPEIVLLYKSSEQSPKNDTDFAAVRPRLSRDASLWLRTALKRCDVRHPWIDGLFAESS